MNNEIFKKFIVPFVRAMLDDVGFERVAEMHGKLGEPICYFVAGGVFGLVTKANVDDAPWRSEPLTRGACLVLNQEEIRCTLDVIRLILETGSLTS